MSDITSPLASPTPTSQQSPTSVEEQQPEESSVQTATAPMESPSSAVPPKSDTPVEKTPVHRTNDELPSVTQQRGKTNTTTQQFCLRWNNYQTNLTSVFDQLLQNESFVDVTLACDGHSIKAHKMMLSACSPYFQSLFFDNPCQHPIIIMRDVKWPELKAAVEFMYKGEINVSQDQIGPLLRVAEMLKIRGLADVKGEQDVTTAEALSAKKLPTFVSTTTTSANISRVEQRKSDGGGCVVDADAASGVIVQRDVVEHMVAAAASRRSPSSSSPKKSRMSNTPPKDWNFMSAGILNSSTSNTTFRDDDLFAAANLRQRKRRWLSTENRDGSPTNMSKHSMTPELNDEQAAQQQPQQQQQQQTTHQQQQQQQKPPQPPPPQHMVLNPFSPHTPSSLLEGMSLASNAMNHLVDDMEIKPEIAEMIREEERVS